MTLNNHVRCRALNLINTRYFSCNHDHRELIITEICHTGYINAGRDVTTCLYCSLGDPGLSFLFKS